ncbi:MAG TPA: hypothetical protein H9662_09660 [Firmicutes bacterium]|nr:hypothetical protein [Bacillota bacterium]
MDYQYKDLPVYHRRSTTDNIAFKIVTDDFHLVTGQSEEYVSLCRNLKAAEETSQLDSCPVAGRAELQALLKALRTKHPDLRARQTQMGPSILTPADADISEEAALFESANGTLANLSSSFTAQECETLVNKGILPIIVKGTVSIGDYIFIEGIRSQIEQGNVKLDAYIIREGYTPVEMELAPLTEEQRKTLLNQ